MKAIEVTNLSKTFTGSVKALDNITFSLDAGEIYGFLGPNGSGKTTTVKILNGVLAASEGTCRVLDIDPSVVPEKLHAMSGVLTEHAQMYDDLTGLQNLVLYAKLFGIKSSLIDKRATEMLERIGLVDAKDQKLGSYSTGMRQRLSLARAMIHQPKILFLDEPTSGLDPESTKEVNDLLKNLSEKQGTTIFLCTHQLRYAQEICTKYGLVDKGVLLADGSIDYLRSLVFSGITVTITTDYLPTGIAATKVGPNVFDVKITSEKDIPVLVKSIVDEGGNVYGVSSREPSLEEVYFALIDQREQQGGASHDQ